MNSKGQVVSNANVMLLRPSIGGGFSSGGGMNRGGDGKFTIANVVPGEYRLVVRPTSGPPPSDEGDTKAPRPEYATVPLNVASDIDDLMVVTQPGVSIVGRVVFAEGTPATVPRIRVQAQPGDRGSFMMGPSPNTTSGADGQFTLNDLHGPLLLRGFPQGGAPTTMPGYTMKAVMLGGTDITDIPIEFKPEHSRHVEIVLTSRASTLEGTVTDDNGAPATDVMVVLIPEDKASWRVGSPRLRMTGIEKEGRFRATRLLAGRYHAVAVPREGFMLSPDTSPELFAELVKEATPVVLNEDETRAVDLRVFRPAR
jgi:hypothetical protein